MTTPHLAARMLYTAHTQYDDIENSIIGDLGIGTGMLSIASCLMGANFCFGLDYDQDALDLCQQNCQTFDLTTSLDILRCDLRRTIVPFRHRTVDTIVMNPPFGTKPFSSSLGADEGTVDYMLGGIDMIFLKHASQIATNSIYSLHKTVTREYIIKKANELNMKTDVIAVMQFDIPKLEKKSKYRQTTTDVSNRHLKPIEVDFIRFEIKDVN
ncbi:unnamed protein product [Didymodactylos carnosus]|uniref:Methyltransferase small domain-containing protein n=1 Tax=Didymodactylos carnosus TaxID=1234261 RepID=A0A813UHG1_9BILA|nr:unnamed protein product [Didymodactylos carnosus]CAF1479945.1 unnamed protein product [Didymodactylos carnosus]CAF3612799.1 unnamed protein product [Didymodactylos carnosus]CAF4270565.1 unnamed protein product [Didymodactylos carnosus]